MDVSAGSQGGAKSRDLEGCLDESVRAMTGLKATIFVSNVVEYAVEKEEHCCHSLSVRLGREEIGMPPPLARKAEPLLISNSYSRHAAAGIGPLYHARARAPAAAASASRDPAGIGLRSGALDEI